MANRSDATTSADAAIDVNALLNVTVLIRSAEIDDVIARSQPTFTSRNMEPAGEPA